ncbi:probable E3 ubiquitin-protein ligase BAH1-like 1 [Dendrobium catenatum]|uniref:probable E3 ubiquitin-protein ligase BAH1-like 1 n=1 Tax=Dendrobium catenatum TaxID=906689 RepID=UPI0009F3D7F7|nr:probable E3 ubiquitin-protein ligase BAH1-like 1 [Dendrobium catenatum]
MKFGETFTGFLHGDQEWFLDNCSHVEYKRLKKVLKACRSLRDSNGNEQEESNDGNDSTGSEQVCQCDICPACDQKFFDELSKEASDIAGCFSSRVRRLLHFHFSNGLQRYMRRLSHCFSDDQQTSVQEVRMLLDYVTMNAVAIRKILKKYDKVHGSVNGRNFKMVMRAKRIELLQSPWLIELGAFYLNCAGSDAGEPGSFFRKFSCDLSDSQPVMTMVLLDSITYEYSLSCPICLDTVFNPYALGCGHLFCKSCVCAAASVLICDGPRSASREAKCPVCREVGAYRDPVHMLELDHLLRSRCKEYWKERLREERAEMVKQAKLYWERQTITALGY